MSASAISPRRADLPVLLRAAHIPAEEPTFTLRARDPSAFDGILGWADASKRRGVSIAVIEQGLQRGDQLLAYPAKLLPDASHLADHEVKQLIYQYARRAWKHRDDERTLDVLMAEQRGWDAAMASLREPPLL